MQHFIDPTYARVCCFNLNCKFQMFCFILLGTENGIRNIKDKGIFNIYLQYFTRCFDHLYN